MQYVFCFVGGILIEIFSIRKIGIAGALISTASLIATAFVTNLKMYMLTYGFFFGVGQAFLLSATEAILPHYFKKRLSLANGLMIFVSAFVIVTLPILTDQILGSHGLRGTFFLLAAINSVSVLMTVSFKSQLPDRHDKTILQHVKSSANVQIFRNVKYTCWLVATFIAMFGYLIPIVNIVNTRLNLTFQFMILTVLFSIKDHHSLKVFPDHKPFYNNIIFGVAGAFGGLLFGKFGDMTVS